MADQELAIANRIDRGTMHSLAMSKGDIGVPMFSSMHDVLEFAKVMAVSRVGVRKHLRNNPGACAAICLQAQRWAMDPFLVANKSYEVNDQIAYEAQLIAAVINTRAPIKGRIKTTYIGEGPERQCIASATFIDDDEPTEVTSPKLKDINPKNSPLWKTDPDQQLAYYTKRAWARRECPEVLLGVYDREELEAEDVRAATARDITPRPTRQQFIEGDAGGDATFYAPAFYVTNGEGTVVEFEHPGEAHDALANLLRASDEPSLQGLWESNAQFITALRDGEGTGPFADSLLAVYTECLDRYIELARQRAAAAEDARKRTDAAAAERDATKAKEDEKQEGDSPPTVEAEADAGGYGGPSQEDDTAAQIANAERIAREVEQQEAEATAKREADAKDAANAAKDAPQSRPQATKERDEAFWARPDYAIVPPKDNKGAVNWMRWRGWVEQAIGDARNLDELVKLDIDNKENFTACLAAAKKAHTDLRERLGKRAATLEAVT